MKKILLTISLLALAVQVQAQGQFSFSTLGGNAIYMDSVSGIRAGTAFAADFFYATASGVTDFSLLTDGNVAKTLNSSGIIIGTTQTFGSGSGLGGSVTGTPGLPTYMGTISLQVRAWALADGATWAAAMQNNPSGLKAYSSIFNVTLGNPIDFPAGTATSIKTLMPSFAFQVPEPSTIALGVMGLSALLFRRRK